MTATLQQFFIEEPLTMTIPTSSISVVIRVEVIVGYCSNTRQILLTVEAEVTVIAYSPGGSQLQQPCYSWAFIGCGVQLMGDHIWYIFHFLCSHVTAGCVYLTKFGYGLQVWLVIFYEFLK